MIPATFDYVAPESVADALAALADSDDAKVLAGGQSLLPILRMRLNAPEKVIDLGRITALRGVREDGDAIVIGAMTAYVDLLADPLVAEHAALLRAAIADGSYKTDSLSIARKMMAFESDFDAAFAR